MAQQATDKEERFVSLLRQGDALATEQLYAENASYLTGVCARYITDDDELKDVLQEAFIKIFTQMDRFEYRGRGSLRAWMSRIVVNESLQAIRRHKQQYAIVTADTLPDLPDDDPEPDGMTPEEMVALMRQLPEGYRTVLNLYVVEGRSHQEIAAMLGIKPDSSASQLHRAKTMLARLIKDYKNKQQ